MTLICTAFGGRDEGESPDVLAVPVTPAFLETLGARQRLAQRLHREAGGESLDSLLFHESSPQWLTWSEELDELLQADAGQGWVLAEDDRIAIAESADATDLPHPVRTDCDFMQVWPDCFQFTCCLRNTDTAIESAMLYFDDLFAAAAQRTAAAPGRHAA